jgi:hypothetical protein
MGKKIERHIREVCSPILAKKLQEAGVNRDVYTIGVLADILPQTVDFGRPFKGLAKLNPPEYFPVIPELDFEDMKRTGILSLSKPAGNWVVLYELYYIFGQDVWTPAYISASVNIADAMAKMILYLKKNNLLK